jgi:hypothetical protein
MSSLLPALISNRPVVMPDGSRAVQPASVASPDLSPIAFGLWAGYLVVLFCPGRKGSPKLGQEHLMQAYGGVMNAFSLV